MSVVQSGGADRPTDVTRAPSRRSPPAAAGATVRPPAHHPSLEPSPLLAPAPGAYAVTVYPQAGEASITRRTRPGTGRRELTADELARRRQRADEAHVRRAKGRCRRFVRGNRCRFLWTLTYRTPVRTLEQAGADLDAVLRRVRDTFGHLPICAVAEPHPGGHGYHWHFATDRRLPHRTMERLWGHGYVWVGDGHGLKGRVPARKLAAYLAKYLSKAAGDDAPNPTVTGRRERQHRYRVTQGFSPERWSTNVSDPEHGYHLLRLLMGDEDVAVWFAVAADGEPDSLWLSYPDGCLHPPPRAEGSL